MTLIKKKNNKNKGFTLVETLVAISILLLGISATFVTIQSGLLATSLVKERVTAFFLAQEAIEGIRNKKDQNLLIRISEGQNPQTHWLEGVMFDNGNLGSCNPGPCDYNVNEDPNTPNDELVNCADYNDCTLRQNEGIYSYEPSGQVTDFNRKIIVTDLSDGSPSGEGPNGVGAKIQVIVTWRDNRFEANDVLQNNF